MRVAWLVMIAGCGFNPAGVVAPVSDAPAVLDDAADAQSDAARDAQLAPVVGWIQGTSGHGTNGDTYQLGYTQAQHAGDFDVVVVTWGTTATHITSVTDSRGNSYTRVTSPGSTGTLSQAMYWAPNVAAGSNTVTVQFDASADTPELRIAEYAGVVTTSPQEHMTQATGSGQSMGATLLATANPHDLIVVANTVESMTDQTDASYTLRLTELGDIFMDKIVPAAGVYNATAHQTNNLGFVFHIVAFKLN